MWLAAGSVPELGEHGEIYNTMLVFDPHGTLVAWHRKAHLYSPTGEESVFTPGDCLTTFEDPSLGRGGPGHLLRRRLPRGGPDVGPARCPPGRWLPRPTKWKGPSPGTSSTPPWRWPTASGGYKANQCGAHGTTTLLGASRIVAPTGTVVAEATRAAPGPPMRPNCWCTGSTCSWPITRRASPPCSRRGGGRRSTFDQPLHTRLEPSRVSDEFQVGPPTAVVADVHGVVEGDRLAEEAGHACPIGKLQRADRHRRRQLGHEVGETGSEGAPTLRGRSDTPPPGTRTSPGLAGTVSRAKRR